MAGRSPDQALRSHIVPSDSPSTTSADAFVWDPFDVWPTSPSSHSIRHHRTSNSNTRSSNIGHAAAVQLRGMSDKAIHQRHAPGPSTSTVDSNIAFGVYTDSSTSWLHTEALDDDRSTHMYGYETEAMDHRRADWPLPASPSLTALPQNFPRHSVVMPSDDTEWPASPTRSPPQSRRPRAMSESQQRLSRRMSGRSTRRFRPESAVALQDLVSTPAWPLPSPAPRISFDERRRISGAFSPPTSPTTASWSPRKSARITQPPPIPPRVRPVEVRHSPVSPGSDATRLDKWDRQSDCSSWTSDTPASSFELTALEAQAVHDAKVASCYGTPEPDYCGPDATACDVREAKVSVVSPNDWLDQFYAPEPDYSDTATDDCPDRATLAAVQHIPIYDSQGRAQTFGSIYEPEHATHQRQMVIFIRHFYCGGCQAYLKALAASISMREYFNIAIPTKIVVIGCGQPSMINYYRTLTRCPFPIFADPSRKLFRKLGMSVTMNLGLHTPQYMQGVGTVPWLANQVKGIHQSLWKEPDNPITMKDVFRGGNIMQVGGEFLFEDGQVVWCHRMTNFRNHAEVVVLRKLLELDG